MRFDGVTYDTGSKIGFLMANAAFALDNPELAEAYKAGLKKLMGWRGVETFGFLADESGVHANTLVRALQGELVRGGVYR